MEIDNLSGFLKNLFINHKVNFYYTEIDFEYKDQDDQDIIKERYINFSTKSSDLCEFKMVELRNSTFRYDNTNFSDFEIYDLFENFILSNRMFQFILERKNALG